MSDSQSSSEFRNDIPVVYPQSCDLPSCPECGGKVKIYLCSDENDPPRWCYSFALPQKNRACGFCHENVLPHLYASPDDAAAGWRAKVMGRSSKSSVVFLGFFGFATIAGFIFLAIITFIQSLNCGCFK